MNQFLNERFVNLEAASSIEDKRIKVISASLHKSLARDLEDVLLARFGKYRQIQLPTQGLLLVYGSRPVNVTGDHQWRSSNLMKEPGELACRGGFA